MIPNHKYQNPEIMPNVFTNANLHLLNNDLLLKEDRLKVSSKEDT
jgi:hypothetical protein